MPEANDRDANSRIGTIGAGARNSQATKATANSSAECERASRPRGWSTPRRCRAAGSRPAPAPRSRPAAAREYRARPPGQNFRAAASSTRTIAIRPIGRLIQKIQRQPSLSVMKPPIAGPMISAHPVTPLKMPSARARSSRPNAPLRIAIASGITSAAPAPCAARAAISASALPAKRAGRRRQHEQRDAGGEHPAASEPVAERGAGQQQHREGQIEGVDRPLQRLDRGAEFGADGGEAPW